MLKRLLFHLLILASLSFGPRWAFADTITWETPLGTIMIPSVSQVRAVGGYDFVLKQGVAGVEAPFWQAISMPDGSKLLDLLDIGAVGVTNSQVAVQPLVGCSIDISSILKLKTIYKDINVGVGGRWASDSGKIGGVAKASIVFGGS